MKNPLKSKTVLLMLLGLAALGVQVAVGEQVIPYEYQGLALRSLRPVSCSALSQTRVSPSPG